MNPPSLLCLSGLCAGLLGHAAPGPGIPSGAMPDHPNFLVIVADDLGATDLGVEGSRFYLSPRLDALAGQGVRLTAGYAAGPNCSPTRSSLMTGRAPARLGHTDYFGAAQPDNLERHWSWRGRHQPLLPAPHVPRLAANERTVATLLRAAGYHTFFAGKWHLGPEGCWPEDHGFEINRGGHHRGGPYGPGGYFPPYNNPRLEDGPPGEHLPDRLATETISFLNRQAQTGEPFLAWLSFYSVHTPLQAPADLVAKHERRRAELGLTDEWAPWGPEPNQRTRLTQAHAVYAAMIEAMDRAVGRVLDQLDATGLSGRTVVVFLSDNGGLSTAEGHPTANVPLRAGKGWLYEGGLRIPWFVRGPGIPAGRVLSAPAVTTDLLPTLLDFAGVPWPTDLPLDGVSLAGWWRGDAAPPARALYWHYPHYSNQGDRPGSAVREGPWKLIWRYETASAELYHLERDPGETRDVAESEPEVTARLRSSLAGWLRSVGAQLPAPNPKFSGGGPLPSPSGLAP